MQLQETALQTTLSLPEINLADPDFWMRDDFHGALALLRKEQPISWHEHPESGKGFWALLDYEDIAEVDKDWERFCSKHGVRVYNDAGTKIRPGTGALIELDPPDHTVNRKRVSKAFMPRQVGRMEEYVREQARRLVSQFSDGQEIDFVNDLAAILPFEIISDLVGIDPADRPRLLELSQIGRSEQELEYVGKPEIPQQAVMEMREYGINLAAKRLLDPKEDLISELAQVRVDGKQLDKEELGGYFGLMIAAGSGTTKAALSHGMLAFSQFPEQRRLFNSDPVLYERTMADEVIRWATPIKHQGRVLTRDIEFKGVQMKEGQKIGMWFIASNRDPRLFKDPFNFDITRDPNQHQSFGAGGPHFCMGANIARREIWMLFQELFARFPNAQAISDPIRERSLQSNGFKHLQVRLSR
ncbi:Cytochrome P450 [Collimonas sp. OK607]|uniref:cytochrome P450 n=1 Tax=Collimonas sp. OK607 TaxID=1798194 RepID=UPI0008EB4629|nr:cytochrome P450 [Collimonas sp. OK607]SFA75407.1 Cytochrome P450 [Collimonas sp. OK607]